MLWSSYEWTYGKERQSLPCILPWMTKPHPALIRVFALAYTTTCCSVTSINLWAIQSPRKTYTGFPVSGLMTYGHSYIPFRSFNQVRITFAGSKLSLPSAPSWNSFPDPWPSNSWLATWSSNARESHALYNLTSSGWMNVNSSSCEHINCVKNPARCESRKLTWRFCGKNILWKRTNLRDASRDTKK